MFKSKDVGIDLGTANTLVYLKNKGIVLREPSVVAVDVNADAVVAVGSEAKDMIGKTPGSIIAVRPLKDGVIASFDITAAMLKYFVRKTINVGMFSKRPKIVICVPSGVTEVEKRAVEDVAHSAGARDVELMSEPMAAAIGANLPVDEPVGSMIVDIGGGTSEVAVISLGDIVTSQSVRVAGNKFDLAIAEYIKEKYKLLIGERTAETIKCKLGSVTVNNKSNEYVTTMSIKGRNLLDGLPKNVEITSAEIRDALFEPLSVIVNAIKSTLELTPPELAGDIINSGITLSGGGALLPGLTELITETTGINTILAEDPLDCVALGTGKRLEVRSKKMHRLSKCSVI